MSFNSGNLRYRIDRYFAILEKFLRIFRSIGLLAEFNMEAVAIPRVMTKPFTDFDISIPNLILEKLFRLLKVLEF